MVLAHNILAMNAQRQFNITSTSKRKSTEKLSSGYRINRAADDAAGLTISEKMRSQIRGLSQGVNNCQDGVSLCQIADGALAEVNDMLHRLTELSVKSANGTNTDSDREAIQKEVSQIISEIDRISSSAEFNTMPIFDGSMANSNTIMTAEELLGPIKPVPIAEPESITYSDALEQLRNQTYILANSSFTNPAGSTYPSYMNDK